MPEACFLCLDSTEYMRNGDQFPNRLMAEQEAANLLINAKSQANMENTVGFLTMGGAACTVFETLTMDVDSVMATLTNFPIGGKRCHFMQALLIASLALSHRTIPHAEKRIVAFVGSPLHETEKELEQLARRLRKDDVAVDVVAFGADGNSTLLQAFIDRVSKNGNSRLLNVEGTANLTDALMSSPILLGENFAAAEGQGGDAGVGFGVDPNVDPELALALRLSMEEEEQRQAALAAAAGGAPAGQAAPQPQQAAPAPAPAPAGPSAFEPLDEQGLANMSEEEMLRRALALSLEEATGSGAAAGAQNEEEGEGSKDGNGKDGNGNEEEK